MIKIILIGSEKVIDVMLENNQLNCTFNIIQMNINFF